MWCQNGKEWLTSVFNVRRFAWCVIFFSVTCWSCYSTASIYFKVIKWLLCTSFAAVDCTQVHGQRSLIFVYTGVCEIKA